ncbi:MAG: adenylate kinase [Actinomycetota bacterium]|nr:adenylate kinase [Sporichthyaceae bacterium]MDQ3449835.1 adenylate kinase [Actinomycetota bacterium]
MRILLIGAPGSGKGTQADRLAARYQVTHISSGDLLRQHVQDATPLGLVVKNLVENGDFVPDSVVMDMLRKPVLAASEAGGYVLDGFPRSVAQAKAAYAVARSLGVEIQVAIHLDVDRDELVRRLLARSRGSEDTAEVIAHRLDVYLEQTAPLVDYYTEREWLVHVDGNQPVDAVTQLIVERIEERLGPASPASA